MKVTCPACSAKYTIAIGRLDGRRAKVRCKRCGDAFVVDPSTMSGEVYARQKENRRARDADLFATAASAGAEASATTEPTAPPLTGERNETSVLFSLAALSTEAPARPAPRAAESSALIDIRAMVSAVAKEKASTPSSDDVMHLSGGGAFASLFIPPLAPPVTLAPVEDEVPARRHVPLVIATTAFVVVGIAGLVGIRSLSSATPTTVVTAPSAVRAPADVPTGAGSAPTNTPAVGPSDAPPAPSTSLAAERAGAAPHNATPARSAHTHDTRAAAAPVPTVSAESAATKCCPGESEMTCHMRISAGAACGAEPPGSTVPLPPFDRLAAARALGIDVAKCKRGESPRGPGHVKVTFQPNGSVSAVDVDAPYAGTAAGACVAQRYRGVSVPAFAGGTISVGKNFMIE